MTYTEKDILAIWDKFVHKTRSKKSKDLKPVVNLLGSVKKHKLLFVQTVKEYNGSMTVKEFVEHKR